MMEMRREREREENGGLMSDCVDVSEIFQFAHVSLLNSPVTQKYQKNKLLVCALIASLRLTIDVHSASKLQ